jgi:uncharacterized membrane protein YoaK (UPF0700 family)
MGPEHLRAMEKWNLLLSGLAVLITALLFEREHVVGVALGALIACANFTAIRKIWEGLLSGSSERKQSMQMLFILKMVALFAIVFVCIRFVPMSAAAFAIGISIFLLSIAVESARYACGHPVQK